MGEARPLRIVLAAPRGFCAGVVRAIEIVDRALRRYGAPVYVRHEIVHNRHVVASLRARGAVFVDEVNEIPPGAVTVFSAHGVSRQVETDAAVRGLDVIDATCPLVHKVHAEARRYTERGHEVILIGHEGHAEVDGTRGQVSGQIHVAATGREIDMLPIPADSRVAYVTQTTLSVRDTAEAVAALKRRFPDAVGQDTRDICYATQNRQSAVLELAGRTELVLVVGSPNSSNSNRLREIAAGIGVPAYLVDEASELNPAWLDGVSSIGLTAGASAPERLVMDVVERLSSWRAVTVETMAGVEESVHFRLPQRLAEAALPDVMRRPDP